MKGPRKGAGGRRRRDGATGRGKKLKRAAARPVDAQNPAAGPWVLPCICSYCGTVYGEKVIDYQPPGPDPRKAATHGICATCFRAWEF